MTKEDIPVIPIKVNGDPFHPTFHALSEKSHANVSA